MSKSKRKINFKELLSAILALVLVLSVVSGCVAISNIDTKTISSMKFKKGDLNAQGAYAKSDTAIYTADLFECQGLTVTLDFESDCQYRVYYYREDKSFIGATALMKEDYAKEEDFENAKYARIVIYPTLEAKDTIGLLEVTSYAKQLTIKVDKNQNFEPVLVPVIPDIQSQLDFRSAFPSRIDLSAFAYADNTLFENKTVRRIGVPIKVIKDINEDSTFTVYVIRGDGSSTFTKVKEIELTIPANTFYQKEHINIADAAADGKTYNYMYTHLGGEEILDYYVIDEWYYFDVNISLGEGESLGFSSTTDDVFFAYHNGLPAEERMGMYATIFRVPGLSKEVEIYFDIMVLE